MQVPYGNYAVNARRGVNAASTLIEPTPQLANPILILVPSPPSDGRLNSLHGVRVLRHCCGCGDAHVWFDSHNSSGQGVRTRVRDPGLRPLRRHPYGTGTGYRHHRLVNWLRLGLGYLVRVPGSAYTRRLT